MLKQLKCRWLAKISLLLLASVALCAIANDEPPVAQCQSYLAMSTASFSNALNNQATAGEISAALSSCEKYNACSEISGIDNCSALLYNRGFDSMLAFNDASTNNSASAATNNTGSYTPIDNTADTSTANSDNLNNADNSSDSDNPVDTGNSNNNSNNKESINWF